ncbi:MAG: endonuclease/exonuclease/phosphatase family protein [Nitrospiraceae bacterium]|nr:endonuclease/exonuclease/phosphatase family protein [Nitrospiraceae bacterium]
MPTIVPHWLSLALCLVLVAAHDSTAVENTSSPIRLLTYNVLHDGPWSGFFDNGTHLEERLDMTIRELQILRPDIIALQEASDSRRHGHVAHRIADSLGYHVIFAAATERLFGIRPLDKLIMGLLGFKEGSAILSRYPIADMGVYDLPRCARRWDPRIVLRGGIDTPQGRIQIFSAHAARGDDCQLQRIGELLDEWKPQGPAVLMGDLNATEDSPSLIDWRDRYGFIDAFRAGNPHLPGFTVWQQIHNRNSTVSRRVDYVFLVHDSKRPILLRSSGLVLDRPGRLPDESVLWPSDHRGVWAEIDLPPGRDGS